MSEEDKFTPKAGGEGGSPPCGVQNGFCAYRRSVLTAAPTHLPLSPPPALPTPIPTASGSSSHPSKQKSRQEPVFSICESHMEKMFWRFWWIDLTLASPK